MFCEKCGKEYKDGAKFCSECGAYIGGGDEKEEIKASSVAYESVYLEKDEVLLAKMGKGCDELLFSNQTTNEMGGLITNKRLYLKGRLNVYTIGQKNGLAVATEKVLNLEDIISTEKVYMLSGYKGVLNACVFRLVVTLVCILAGVFWAEPFQLLGLAYFVLCIIEMGWILTRKANTLVIEYIGGRISFRIKRKYAEEAEKFLRKIHEAGFQKEQDEI